MARASAEPSNGQCRRQLVEQHQRALVGSLRIDTMLRMCEENVKALLDALLVAESAKMPRRRNCRPSRQGFAGGLGHGHQQAGRLSATSCRGVGPGDDRMAKLPPRRTSIGTTVAAAGAGVVRG